MYPQCLAQKFIVFNTTLDLQAHVVEEHGSAMTARDKKDARRVAAEFEFEDIGLRGRHSSGVGARRERQRELPPQHLSAGTSSRDVLRTDSRTTEISRGSSFGLFNSDVDPVVAE